MRLSRNEQRVLDVLADREANALPVPEPEEFVTLFGWSSKRNRAVVRYIYDKLREKGAIRFELTGGRWTPRVVKP